MEVSLPPQLEEFVRAQARSGRYADEAEVVRDAVRQMRALVKAAEDPTVAGLVRDAMGIANQAQRDVANVLQIADRETSVLGEVVGSRGFTRQRRGRRRAQGARRARARPGGAGADRSPHRDRRAGRGAGQGDAPEPRGDGEGARRADRGARTRQQREPHRQQRDLPEAAHRAPKPAVPGDDGAAK